MTASAGPLTLLAMRPADLADRLFGPGWASVRAVADLVTEQVVADYADVPDLLDRVEVVVTGWGAPPLTSGVLASMPALKAVVHGAGATDFLFPEGLGGRSLLVSNAGEANGVPVAEFTVAMIILAGKDTFAAHRRYTADRGRGPRTGEPGSIGNYGRTVGLVSASRIGRRVAQLLQPYDFDVIMYDPFLSDADAATLGVRSVPLAELMATSDVISLHTPVLPTTRGMITAELIATIKDGATFINTARGAIVDEPALVAELTKQRFDAYLDVTLPEPPDADSPLWDLPNVILTPHIAGSMGNELLRMGESAAAELGRVARGEPLLFADPVWSSSTTA